MSEAPLTTRLHWGTAHCPQGPCILYVIMTVWHIGGWEWGFIWILGVRQLIELDFLFYEKINRNFSNFSQLLWIALCTSWGGEVFPSWRSLLVITCVDNLKTCLLRWVWFYFMIMKYSDYSYLKLQIAWETSWNNSLFQSISLLGRYTIKYNKYKYLISFCGMYLDFCTSVFLPF